VNIHLITLVTGLAESFHFAERQELSMQIVAELLAAGPLTSQVSRMKADKLVARDMSPQAAARDVLYNCRVIMQEARGAAIETPLLDACRQLYEQTQRLGHGADDMIGVVRALRAFGQDQP
jgi:3-hydroxyisobutyrate dehydrogenase